MATFPILLHPPPRLLAVSPIGRGPTRSQRPREPDNAVHTGDAERGAGLVGLRRQREGGQGQTEKSSQAGEETRAVPVTIAT